MKYGFDHCRVCGKPIAPRGQSKRDLWEAAQRKPPMPEKRWRALGFLAAPTAYQLNVDPADGCCADCGLAVSHRTSRFHVRGIASVVGTVTMGVAIAYIIFYMRQ